MSFCIHISDKVIKRVRPLVHDASVFQSVRSFRLLRWMRFRISTFCKHVSFYRSLLLLRRSGRGWMVVAAPRPSLELQELNGGDWNAALLTSLTTATSSLPLLLSIIAADLYIPILVCVCSCELSPKHQLDHQPSSNRQLRSLWEFQWERFSRSKKRGLQGVLCPCEACVKVKRAINSKWQI